MIIPFRSIFKRNIYISKKIKAMKWRESRGNNFNSTKIPK